MLPCLPYGLLGPSRFECHMRFLLCLPFSSLNVFSCFLLLLLLTVLLHLLSLELALYSCFLATTRFLFHGCNVFLGYKEERLRVVYECILVSSTSVQGATVISGNTSSNAMAGVTTGGSGSSAITTPCTDWCKLLSSGSLSASSALAVPK